jgi:hypothetical protein
LAQLIGYCPLSIGKRNRVHFSWFSLPFFMALFHPTAITAWCVRYFVHDDHREKLFRAQLETDVLGFYSVIIVTFYCQTFIRIVGVLWRKDVLIFWNELYSLSSQIYEAGTTESKIRYEEELRRRAKKNLRIVGGICLVVGINAWQLIGKAFLSRAIAIDTFEEYRSPIFTCGLVLWNFHTIVHITKTLWHVHLIELLSTGFLGLGPHHTNEHVYLKQYKSLSGLVDRFNTIFTVELVVSLIALTLYLTNFIYTYCVTVATAIAAGATDVPHSAPGIMLVGLSLFLLCSSATEVTKQVRGNRVIGNYEGYLRSNSEKRLNITVERRDRITCLLFNYSLYAFRM